MGLDDGSRPRRPARSSTGSPRPTTASASSTSGRREEQFEQFAQEQIGPYCAQAGIPGPPEMRFTDVHNYLGG